MKSKSTKCPISGKPAIYTLIDYHAITAQEDLVVIKVDSLGVVYAIELDDYNYVKSQPSDFKTELMDFITNENSGVITDMIAITRRFEPMDDINDEM